MKLSIKVICAAICIVGFAIPNASAADDTVNYTTATHVKLHENTDNNSQVDPESPTNVVTPADPNGHKPGVGTAGPLSIDYVSSLNFGMQKTSTVAQQYAAYATIISMDTSKKYVAPYVQVTDNRAMKTGWSLKVAQSTWTSDDSKQLNGATLSLGTQGALTNNLEEPYTNGDYAPVPVNDDIELDDSGEQQIVMTAEESKGFGTWVKTFGALASSSSAFPTEQNDFTNMPLTTGGAQLTVPESNTAGDNTYTTTLTWTLEDTP
ncbi:WxL domain-containing protein [Periweissella cryptocerci]|uniref:WxL domain-containing protein n=1 Tax=Periweissella cryptocerci TaxID=2506420 RepID=A0A4P6YUG7_9LACO|nr:WxL domain-containing protein [Periweissella cryptocerci]QBO36382.1 WxL domain-containing protein [Periweissella cryptocerci]